MIIFWKIVILFSVFQEADYERTFVLDKSPIKRTLVASTADISACQSQQLHLQQLQQQPHQLGPGENVSGEPIILMRTKGNPNVLVQVKYNFKVHEVY